MSVPLEVRTAGIFTLTVVSPREHALKLHDRAKLQWTDFASNKKKVGLFCVKQYDTRHLQNLSASDRKENELYRRQRGWSPGTKNTLRRVFSRHGFTTPGAYRARFAGQAN